MHGARRVVIFCLLTAVLPTILLIIPLYLRHSLYADVIYTVSESDVLEATDKISTVFCQEQILTMNTSFRAFQLEQLPPLSDKKKHIRLHKSMVLPDDSMEYWGFYLLAGSKVRLSACSRYYGAGVIAVKGGKHLRTCGLMDLTDRKRPSKKPNEVDEILNSRKKELRIADKATSTDDLQAIKENLKDLIAQLPYGNKTRRHNDRKFRHVKKKFRFLNNLNTSNSSSHHLQNFDQTEKKSNDGQEGIKELIKLLQSSDADISENIGGEETDEGESIPHRFKRSVVYTTGHILDARVGHGGNANVTEDEDGESSESSFEFTLRQCYFDQIITKNLDPSPFCLDPYSLNVSHKIEPLEILDDGYYYFIFYSDNDKFPNPVHAHFDVYKTTYQNTNYTRGCINQTECRFPITFWSNEIVIVEVPTHDGIEHGDEILFLVSSCYPRMAIYVVFPVAVLFLILGCAFI